MTSDAFELTGRPRNALLLAARLLLAFIFIHEGVFSNIEFRWCGFRDVENGRAQRCVCCDDRPATFRRNGDRAGDLHPLRRNRARNILFPDGVHVSYTFWRAGRASPFREDFAIAGGLLVLALHGVGDWSVEALRARALDMGATPLLTLSSNIGPRNAAARSKRRRRRGYRTSSRRNRASKLQAHSPLRNTGVRAPFASRPSMSILSEPIIQSIWIMLLLPPCAAICSGLSFAPSTKHFV